MIRVFTTPTCPYCKLVKDLLKELGHPFEEVDATIQGHAQELTRLSGSQCVPVTEKDGNLVIGWNKQALIELVGHKQD